MLSVRRGAKAVEFYKSAFGADVLYRVDAPDGAVVARLSAGGAEFWIADESPEHKNFSPESLGGGTVRMVMTTEEPDQAFAKAVAAGLRWFGRWEINMAGASEGTSIRSGITRRSLRHYSVRTKPLAHGEC